MPASVAAARRRTIEAPLQISRETIDAGSNVIGHLRDAPGITRRTPAVGGKFLCTQAKIAGFFSVGRVIVTSTADEPDSSVIPARNLAPMATDGDAEFFLVFRPSGSG